MSERIYCPDPACPDPYDVQKVTEIVRAGTVFSSEHYSGNLLGNLSGHGYSGRSSSTASSSLANVLNAGRPVIPWAPKRKEARPAAQIGLLWVSVSIMAWLLLTPFIAMAAPDVSFNAIISLTGLISLGIGLYGLWRTTENAKSNDSLYQRELVAYNQEYERYQKSLARWQASYYSPRCGCVFVPGELRYVPVERMRDLVAY